jgi:anti-anti-sigma factor
VVAGVPTIYLEGELDSYSAPRVRNVLDTWTECRQPELIIEVSGLEYIDSAGLGVLVGALKQVNDNDGTMAIAGLTAPVARVFHVTGLEKLFTVCATEADAQEKLRLAHAG